MRARALAVMGEEEILADIQWAAKSQCARPGPLVLEHLPHAHLARLTGGSSSIEVPALRHKHFGSNALEIQRFRRRGTIHHRGRAGLRTDSW